jgi:hypothetical protein
MRCASTARRDRPGRPFCPAHFVHNANRLDRLPHKPISLFIVLQAMLEARSNPILSVCSLPECAADFSRFYT